METRSERWGSRLESKVSDGWGWEKIVIWVVGKKKKVYGGSGEGFKGRWRADTVESKLGGGASRGCLCSEGGFVFERWWRWLKDLGEGVFCICFLFSKRVSETREKRVRLWEKGEELCVSWEWGRVLLKWVESLLRDVVDVGGSDAWNEKSGRESNAHKYFFIIIIYFKKSRTIETNSN